MYLFHWLQFEFFLEHLDKNWDDITNIILLLSVQRAGKRKSQYGLEEKTFSRVQNNEQDMI